MKKSNASFMFIIVVVFFVVGVVILAKGISDYAPMNNEKSLNVFAEFDQKKMLEKKHVETDIRLCSAVINDGTDGKDVLILAPILSSQGVGSDNVIQNYIFVKLKYEDIFEKIPAGLGFNFFNNKLDNIVDNTEKWMEEAYAGNYVEPSECLEDLIHLSGVTRNISTKEKQLIYKNLDKTSLSVRDIDTKLFPVMIEYKTADLKNTCTVMAVVEFIMGIIMFFAAKIQIEQESMVPLNVDEEDNRITQKTPMPSVTDDLEDPIVFDSPLLNSKPLSSMASSQQASSMASSQQAAPMPSVGQMTSPQASPMPSVGQMTSSQASPMPSVASAISTPSSPAMLPMSDFKKIPMPDSGISLDKKPTQGFDSGMQISSTPNFGNSANSQEKSGTGSVQISSTPNFGNSASSQERPGTGSVQISSTPNFGNGANSQERPGTGNVQISARPSFSTNAGAANPMLGGSQMPGTSSLGNNIGMQNAAGAANPMLGGSQMPGTSSLGNNIGMQNAAGATNPMLGGSQMPGTTNFNYSTAEKGTVDMNDSQKTVFSVVQPQQPVLLASFQEPNNNN